jgi:hypothetical protein
LNVEYMRLWKFLDAILFRNAVHNGLDRLQWLDRYFTRTVSPSLRRMSVGHRNFQGAKLRNVVKDPPRHNPIARLPQVSLDCLSL